MPYSGREIIVATGGTLLRGNAERVFADVSTDTREPQSGKLFIPLRGARFDGHGFLAVAATGGVAGVLLEKGREECLKGIDEGATAIAVDDTLVALGDIAHYWRTRFNIPVVAITGSAGKTTTKEMTARILGRVINTLQTEGNFNNLVGMPLTLLRLKTTHAAAILEMGTNVPGEIGRLSRIAAPTVGLITNVGPAHLEGLKSVSMVKEEKGELFRHLPGDGTAVVNIDDEAVRELAGRRSGHRINYGLQGCADVTAAEVSSGPWGLSFVLKIGEDRGRVKMAAVGVHNLMNALAAAAISHALGAPPEVIRQGLQDFKNVPGRMEIIPLRNGVFLVNDTYNANPVSVREALIALKDLRGAQRGMVILGDMLELGEQAVAWHEEIGGLLAATGVEKVFLQGAFAPATAAGALKEGIPAARIFYPATPEEMLAELSSTWRAGDWLLVKGSRAMKMETVVQKIMERCGVA